MDLLEKYREQVPEGVTDEEILDLINSCNEDDVQISRTIDSWWKDRGDQSQSSSEHRRQSNQKRGSAKENQSTSSQKGEKEMMDFRHLMVKGLELKRYRGASQPSEKCVIYMDVTCRTFFCGKQKNANSAKALQVEDIDKAVASALPLDKIINIIFKDGSLNLEVSSPKVRDYLVRMLNKLFTMEKNRGVEKESSVEERSPPRSSRSRKNDRGSSNNSKYGSSQGQTGFASSPIQRVSQMRLLAEHCFSVKDEVIENMINSKIPTHSRWESYQEFKDKINRRDELIRALQEGLSTMNQERIRFQRACEDIETHHQEDLTEMKQHLAMALTSFQELQRASEHRESEMREALKGANERSGKFEKEKAQLLESMNDQKILSSSSTKEVEMLRETIQHKDADAEKIKIELSDVRNRFSQIREALSVERNLRARAEIKEEQMRLETIAVTGQMHAIRNEFQDKGQASAKEVEDRTAELQSTIDSLEKEVKAQEESLVDKANSITRLEGEVESLSESLKSRSNESEKLKNLSKKAGLVDGLTEEIERLKESNDGIKKNFEQKIVELEELVQEKEDLLVKADETRRKMHNKIQELRGNIRVYVRVRPFLGHDQVDLENNNQSCVTTGTNEVDCEIVNREDGQIVNSHKWEFDKAFGMTSTQDHIFDEVSEFVQSAIDGYNVCLFSYGQTGSGKTHTMTGTGKGEMKGIIPRAIEQIGAYRDKVAEKGWIYEMKVTFVEIYNEEVRDLLMPPGSPKVKLDIKQEPKTGNTYVAGATMEPCDPDDKDHIDQIMTTAAINRATEKTEMNPDSSRSHSIFTLHLVGVNAELGGKVKGTLHLCDLAGSERVKRSGAVGDRAKEAVSINKSLSCLKDVFIALAKNQSFIPFRNSKLTYLLQPAFSGDGKTMMFVNLSPTNESYNESLCSLRFASDVNKIELGKAKKNVSEMTASQKEKAQNEAAAAEDDSQDGEEGAKPRSPMRPGGRQSISQSKSRQSVRGSVRTQTPTKRATKRTSSLPPKRGVSVSKRASAYDR